MRRRPRAAPPKRNPKRARIRGAVYWPRVSPEDLHEALFAATTLDEARRLREVRRIVVGTEMQLSPTKLRHKYRDKLRDQDRVLGHDEYDDQKPATGARRSTGGGTEPIPVGRPVADECYALAAAEAAEKGRLLLPEARVVAFGAFLVFDGQHRGHFFVPTAHDADWRALELFLNDESFRHLWQQRLRTVRVALAEWGAEQEHLSWRVPDDTGGSMGIGTDPDDFEPCRPPVGLSRAQVLRIANRLPQQLKPYRNSTP
jgi:hypothetical protein